MFPTVAAVAAGVVGIVVIAVSFLDFLFGGPTEDNDTVAEIEARLRRETALEARQLANAKRERALKAERKRTMEAAALLEARNMKEKADARLRLANEKEKKQLEDRMKELERRDQLLRDEVVTADRLVEQERAARVAAEHGVRGPTRAKHDHARRITQYSSAKFHFAIVGRAGSGKSSLINAFRNLRNKDPGAAPTGTRETTLEIGRYPDPGEQPPRNSMVWACMCLMSSSWRCDRFEKIDAQILENCARFRIPAFIVRSKADVHILNSMHEYGDYDRPDDNPECYDRCRRSFIVDTQNTVDEELTRQNLPTQQVFIVSRDVLRRIYHASMETFMANMAVATITRPEKYLIHESHLASALLTAAIERRCNPNPEPTPGNWMGPNMKLPLTASAVEVTKDGSISRVPVSPPPPAAGRAQQPELIQARTDPVAAASHAQQPEQVQEQVEVQKQLQVDPLLTLLQVSRDIVSRQSPMPRAPANIRKIIHPPSPTNATDLYREIVEHNPGLDNMLVGQPKMFTATIAMLTFYPLAPVPRDVQGFGVRLRLTEYQDRGGGRGGRGGRGSARASGRGRGRGRAEKDMVRFFGKRKVGELDKQCWMIENKLVNLAKGQIFRMRMGETLDVIWRD
ncbi:Interferon-inducible GTPase (IIGP) [Maublancomyces gigas]|uniref:Interferon-inducible GTPase (IIGP) n=1 Tax=Discina gigas TaxID=1032678 RepID=A0ABR3GCN5_9PEZI